MTEKAVFRWYSGSFAFLTALYLFFQADPAGSISGHIDSYDDACYFSQIASLVNDRDLDFSNQPFRTRVSDQTGKIVSPHAIGTPLLLLPFYAVAKPIVHLLNWRRQQPFDQSHPLFFVFLGSGSVLYLYLAGLMLLKALGRQFSAWSRLVALLLIIWGTILPVYAFRRTLLSHVPDFFIVSALLLFISVLLRQKRIKNRHFFFLGLLTGGAVIVRWQNLNLLLLGIYFILAFRPEGAGAGRDDFFPGRIGRLAFYLGGAGLLFFCTQGLSWKYQLGRFFIPPWSWTTPRIIDDLGLRIWSPGNLTADLKNFFHILGGRDWGLIYTSLPFLAGLLGFLICNPVKFAPGRRGALRDRLVYALIFFLPFGIVLRWLEQGSSYGYRYLISLFPFAGFGLCALLDHLFKSPPGNNPAGRRITYLVTALILLFNFFLMLPFRYVPSTDLFRGKTVMGGYSWANNAYVANAVRFYFDYPKEKVLGVFGRGYAAWYGPGRKVIVARSREQKIGRLRLPPDLLSDPGKRLAVSIYPLLLFSFLGAAYLITTRLERRSGKPGDGRRERRPSDSPAAGKSNRRSFPPA